MDASEFDSLITSRQFLNELQEGIWVANADGNVVWANQALAAFCGYASPEELAGKSWRELLPPTEVVRFGKLKPEEDVWTLRDSAILRRGNRTTPASIVVTRKLAAGRTWYVGTVLPALAIAPAVPTADAASREAMDSAIDGICIIENGRITYANRRFEELTGYSSAQLGRMSLDRLVAPASRNALVQIMTEPGKMLAPVHHEVWVVNRSGRQLDCELRIVPISVGGSTALLCFLRDISQLRRAERAQSDFIATVSHELRTPLATTKEAISLLFETAGSALDQRPRRYLEIAREEMDRLNRMVTNLIESSRMDVGKVTLRVEPVALAEVLDQSLASLSLLLTKRGLRVDKDIPAKLPLVLADRDRLLQVFNNLLDNAIKYSPQGGVVKVMARVVEPETVASSENGLLPDTKYVQVDVSDSGPGIPAEFLDRIFGRFERVDPHGPGIGLGLSIVRSIIQMHHGKVWAKSSFGEGATFSFLLPAKEDHG
ncbi:MAG: ATP-binding protein [candidate division WOR-3 bacterium]